MHNMEMKQDRLVTLVGFLQWPKLPPLRYFGVLQLLSAVPQQWCQQTAAPWWWYQELIRPCRANCSLPPLPNETAESEIKEIWGLLQKADCFQILRVRSGDWCSCGQESATEVFQSWRWFGKCLLRWPVMMAEWQQRERAVKGWQFCEGEWAKSWLDAEVDV